MLLTSAKTLAQAMQGDKLKKADRIEQSLRQVVSPRHIESFKHAMPSSGPVAYDHGLCNCVPAYAGGHAWCCGRAAECDWYAQRLLGAVGSRRAVPHQRCPGRANPVIPARKALGEGLCASQRLPGNRLPSAEMNHFSLLGSGDVSWTTVACRPCRGMSWSSRTPRHRRTAWQRGRLSGHPDGRGHFASSSSRVGLLPRMLSEKTHRRSWLCRRPGQLRPKDHISPSCSGQA